MKKFLITIITTMLITSAWADQPKNWQLGFQDSASQSMTEIVSFHNNILLPVIIAISVFPRPVGACANNTFRSFIVVVMSEISFFCSPLTTSYGK